MSAKIVVVAGPGLGEELWIEDEVLRLGSDPQCELALAAPDLVGHAATLEYLEGVYLVHNRGRDSLWLDGVEIEPQATAAWSDGETLKLSGSLSVTLLIDGDPTPRRRPRFDAADAEMQIPDEAFDEEPLPGSAAPPPVTNLTTYLRVAVVIGVAAIGAVALFFDPTALASGPVLSPEDDFAVLMELHNALDDNLREPLQLARQAQARGDDEYADHLYGAMLEILSRRKTAAGQLSDAEQNAWDYVGRRRDELK